MKGTISQEDIAMKELRNAIKRIRDGKAPGHDSRVIVCSTTYIYHCIKL